MAISFDDIYTKLVGWGYQVTKEPEESKPPGKIEMRYDMDMEPEDVAMSSYKVTHEVEFKWNELSPDNIAISVITLMGKLGTEYGPVLHFEIGKPKLIRSNGTLYLIQLSISWIQWVSIR
jgi:hypothetical protein